MRIGIRLTLVAVVLSLAVPSAADDRPNDPFGNHTAELNEDAPLFRVWKFLRDQVLLDKEYFYKCLESPENTCPSLPTFLKILDEARQYQGKALLGHLNRSINLLIKATPGTWVGPLDVITMRHGDCKAYSIAKYAAVRASGISPDFVRLVIVHDRRHSEDHMVAAVYQSGDWYILDNLTNLLLRDSEKTDYEPLAVLDYIGPRRYLSAFWVE